MGNDYELIRVATEPDEKHGGQFLGIDIATAGGYSLLETGLTPDVSVGDKESLASIHTLLCLHFQPKLNRNVLLQEKGDALLFGKVVQEMKTCIPGYFELEEFYPQFLYLENVP